jgi:diguanylate cyclase (GGDEF)-like protein
LNPDPGLIDLRSHDFEADPVLPLNGQWLFYPDFDRSKPQAIEVPGSWRRSGLPEQGCGTYRLRVLLPEERPVLALKFGSLYTSAAVRINGKEELRIGQPGNSEDTYTPHWVPTRLKLSGDSPGELLLEIDMANFSHVRGGIITPVLLGNAQKINIGWEISRMLEMVFMGIILWMGIYHFSIFLLRSKSSRESLFFAVACLLFGIRLLFIGDFLISSFYMPGVWTLFLRIEYLLYVWSVYFFIKFLSLMYPEEFFKPIVTLFLVITASYAGIILVSPSVFYTSLLPGHQQTVVIAMLMSIFFLAKAAIRRRSGAGLILFGLIFLILTTVNDVLHYNVQIIQYNTSIIGTVVFMIIDSYVLAQLFTQKFVEVEELSITLRDTNAELAQSRYEIEKKNSELRLLASSDHLTGLPNRMALFELVDRELARAVRNGNHVGVILVDLDNFKQINDSYGHDRGDMLLCEFSRQMRRVLRKSDTIFRLGGDEFTVIVPDLTEPENLILVAKKIMDVLKDPIELDSLRCSISTSQGISRFPDDGDSVHTLLKNADIALYEAKRLGRNRFVCFDRHMQKMAEDRFTLINRMPDALKNGEFELYYQPQMDMKDYSMYGLEVLIRWKEPELGFVPPSVFIPLMEESGFINVLGEWILEQALIKTLPWVKKNRALLVSVNLSSVQFNSPDFLDILDFILVKTGFPQERLVLELTEGVIMHDSEKTLLQLQGIRDRGVQISVDDFGTGYSSLSYLKRFPLDHLKIDKSFIGDLFSTQFDKDIVSTIIDLAGILGLEVIAEGIETTEQQAFLESRGCFIMQGYLMGRPVPEQKVEKLVIDREGVKEFLQML